ncbi:MAG TPA: metallophosphoesterase family protein [Candidatus Dormibacteraeota bacterium]|nr:metallophosphoesterase family protein [Candidatus Dormibacteraeota bacterium]
MRYAFFSDIHSNLESLERALAHLAPDDVLVSLGDVVGYGPNPNECVAILRARARHAVMGNHDLAAIENFGIEYFNEAAKEAMIWTQGVLDEPSRAWLNGLGYELRFPEFLLVHGAPVRYFDYILEKRNAVAAFAATDAPLIFVGHTHVAQHWSAERNGSVGHRHMQRGGELQLDPAKRYIIDVGSVGQPRDLNPNPCFVLYEPENGRVEWVRYGYPISTVQRKIRAAKLPAYLADRLDSGR